MKDGIYFLPVDKRFLQSVECVVRHAQITQNNKFAISVQYLQKKVSDKVDCLHADKHKSLLQIDTMILIGMIKYSQRSQNSNFPITLQNLKKKKLKMVLNFSMQVNIKVFYELISTLWASTFCTRQYSHY